VGAELGLELEVSKCPICQREMTNTLGSQSLERKPMSLEENIGFIKNQLDFSSQ